MAAEIVTNIIVIAVVVLLIVSLRLSKKPKHLVLGAILIMYGGIKLLSYHEAIQFDTLENSDCAHSLLQHGESNRNFRRAQKHAPHFSAGLFLTYQEFQ